MSVVPGYCKRDGCESPAGRTGFCESCLKGLRDIQRDLNRPVKPVKGLKRTPVNKVSQKRAYENGRYSEAVKSWIVGKRCACCGDPATECHHKMGRENDLLMEKKYWLPVCHGCHVLITEDSAWAIANGYSISRTGAAANPVKDTL